METQPTNPQTPQSTEPIVPPVSQSVVDPVKPVAPKKSPLIPVLIILLVLFLSAAIYFFLQSRVTTSSTTDENTNPSQLSSPIPSQDLLPIETDLPEGWVYQPTEFCDVSFATPPQIPDVDNRKWTVESGPDQPFGLWDGQSYRLIHRNPEEASGFISGIVSVSCGPITIGMTTDSLLDDLQKHLEAERVKNNDSEFIIQLASSEIVEKWNMSVHQLTFTGGMYDPTRKYYFFSYNNKWYLISSRSMSTSSIIQDQTVQILSSLKFTN